jgi:hypothetical protein
LAPILTKQEEHLDILYGPGLVEKFGADVNQATFAGRTPLHAAARYGNLDLVVCLVKVLSADVHRQALDGSFALIIGKLWACRFCALPRQSARHGYQPSR